VPSGIPDTGAADNEHTLESATTRQVGFVNAAPFTLLNTDIREAPTARVGADQIDTCATSQNGLVKDEPEGQYADGARATKVTAYAAACTKASTPRDASSA
jgi:hypothetical protein